MTRVIFSGGGTLGSVTPLLAVAENLFEQQPESEFLWIGTKDGPERDLVEEAGIKFSAIPSGRLRRFASWSNLIMPILVLRGFFAAAKILQQFKPDIVVSAGSFVAVPIVWAAWLLRIPVHVHQLDWEPGLANKLSAPFAKSISATFEKSKNDFNAHKVVVTGNPVRRFLFTGSIEEARTKFKLQSGIPTILVLGGGTGAVALNSLVIEMLPKLKRKIQIIHLTGRAKSVLVPNAPEIYQQFAFLNQDMALAYAIADLVISRAGMGTLTELAALGLPTIVVPILNSHQEANAEYFVQNGGAILFNERQSSAALAQLVQDLLADSKRLRQMSISMLKINNPQAAQRLIELIKR
jgi:UDP-N-acetylglucosamine--N-acetylmuramyl-(pentapeptide) pyrophosphoryl-undecaprenol N-acetylglucosamine transferase